jgi:hypothetical protein
VPVAADGETVAVKVMLEPLEMEELDDLSVVDVAVVVVLEEEPPPLLHPARRKSTDITAIERTKPA